MPDNISIIFYALPIYQLLYYSVQLLTFRGSNPSRKYLGLLLVNMTFFLVINAFYQHGSTAFLAGSYFFVIPLLLMQPAFFYLYIHALAREGESIKWFSKFILFIPVILVLLFNLLIFGITSTSNFEKSLADIHSFPSTSIGTEDTPLLMLWFSMAFILAVQLILAIFKIKTLLEGEKAIIKTQPSHPAILQFKWVYFMSFSLLSFIIAGDMLLLFIGTNGITVTILYNVIMLLSGGLLGYYGMKQDDLLTEVSSVAYMPVSITDNYDNIGPTGTLPNKTKKALPDLESKEIIKKIVILMEQEKPYLDKHYSITTLCRQIEVKQNKVTYVINEVMGKNFYGFINEYRVREAMQIMMIDDQNLTIDAIADLVGFHSRSSFYPCFMKYSGLTPKEFVGKVKRAKLKDIESMRRQ